MAFYGYYFDICDVYEGIIMNFPEMTMQFDCSIRHFGGLNENRHHWFFHLNSRPLVGRNILVELGAVVLLEEVCH